MKKPIIGVVCLVRKTFDYETAYKLFLERTEALKKDTSVDYIVYSSMVIEENEAKEAGTYFLAHNVDALVVVSATFHLGSLALIINNIVKKPLLLQGYNELPYDGGKIRLNAVCGVNLNASNLYKAGVKDFVVYVGDRMDEDWIKAIKMKVAIENGHIGLVGYHAEGFYNVGVDELHLYKELGVLISHYELSDFFSGDASKEDIEKERKNLLSIFDCHKLNDFQIEQVSKLIVNAEAFMKEKALDVVAIRCWPEFAKNYGVSPCAMMSVLQSRGILLACEGDIEAAISMLAVKAAGETTPFMADLSQVNYAENYALLWHDGVAPCSLWDHRSIRSLETYFAGGKGVTADFVLKSGDISILRIDTARGKTRLYYEEGTAIDMNKDLSGTYAKVIFARHVKDVVDTVAYSGVAHHVIMGYVQYKKAVTYLARIKGWELIDENYRYY